jgi:hypothetical protein
MATTTTTWAKEEKTKQNNQKNGRFLLGMGLLCALSMGVEDWVLWELGKNEKDGDNSLTTWNVLIKENVGWLFVCLFACLTIRLLCVCALWELGANKRKSQSGEFVISQKQQQMHSNEASSLIEPTLNTLIIRKLLSSN